jgi:hypothetical protein
METVSASAMYSCLLENTMQILMTVALMTSAAGEKGEKMNNGFNDQGPIKLQSALYNI